MITMPAIFASQLWHFFMIQCIWPLMLAGLVEKWNQHLSLLNLGSILSGDWDHSCLQHHELHTGGQVTPKGDPLFLWCASVLRKWALNRVFVPKWGTHTSEKNTRARVHANPDPGLQKQSCLVSLPDEKIENTKPYWKTGISEMAMVGEADASFLPLCLF